MSKRTRPKSRSERRALRESQPASRRPAEKQEPQRPTTTVGKLRRFVPAIAVADALLAVTAIVLAFAGVMVLGAPLATLPSAIAEVWMISHLAPFVFEGVTVSMLPVLPAIGVVAVVASRIRAVVRAKVSTVDLGIVLATALLTPVLITLITWLMLWDAAKVFPVEPPPLLETLARVLTLHLVAFVLGLGSRLWRALFRRYGLPRSLIDGAKDASRFFQLVCGAALVLIAVLAVVGFERQQEALSAFPSTGAGAVIGLVLVTLLYLPNAIFSGASVLLGGDFAIGQASVSLFSIHLVPLPPTPLSALIPGEAHPAAPALLLISAAAAVVVWVQARPRPMQLLGATISIGVIVLVANFLSSGELGWYGWTGPTWWLAPILAMVWLGLIGLTTYGALAMTRRRRALQEQRKRNEARRQEEAQAESELETEAEAEPEADAEEEVAAEEESVEEAEPESSETDEPDETDESEDTDAPEDNDDTEDTEDTEDSEDTADNEDTGIPEGDAPEKAEDAADEYPDGSTKD